MTESSLHSMSPCACPALRLSEARSDVWIPEEECLLSCQLMFPNKHNVRCEADIFKIGVGKWKFFSLWLVEDILLLLSVAGSSLPDGYNVSWVSVRRKQLQSCSLKIGNFARRLFHSECACFFLCVCVCCVHSWRILGLVFSKQILQVKKQDVCTIFLNF